MGNENNYREGLDIAIVGMAGRFPGAGNIEEFYENLKEGKSGISFFDKEELIEYGVPREEVEKPNYVRAKGIIESAEEFDNKFFGYTPVEAKVMDPQTRLMHECVWESLENAGYKFGLDNSLVGVYVGGSPNPMWETLTFLDGDIEELNPFTRSILNNADLMATRVSYKLNLKGPSVSFFTSCSTSLVAIHTAVQSLLSGECDIAVAGGVSAVYPNKQGYEYKEGMHLSPDGCCRSFDAKAKGLVISDAIGLLVLKRVEDAIRDNDTIDALIIGSAINNDGSQKVGYTAPSVDGQEQVIKYAQELAEIEPKDVAYVETHGSGTMLGDNIEIEALRRVFKIEEGAKLTIGTCKTNIGHTNSASGVVGVIKTVLSLKYKEIFPHINFRTPLPELELEDNPFHIALELEKLDNSRKELIAGVSSFGVGGTNAHVILKGYHNNVVKEDSLQQQCGQRVIILSAKTDTALDKKKEDLRKFLEINREVSLNDLEYTLQMGRTELDYRCAFSADSLEKVIMSLQRGHERGVWKEKVIEKPLYVWMFSGQGKQYQNMGREIYKEVPYFRDTLNECFEISKNYSDIDFKQYFSSDTEDAENDLKSTEIIQPVLFCLEYSLARYLEKIGVPMDYLIGYSFGEITAACLAGVVSLQDALKMIISRGKVMKDCELGELLSVPLPSAKLNTIMGENICIAIDNGESCVVSGRNQDIEEFNKNMKKNRVLCIKLESKFAAHSFLMKNAADEFQKVMEQITLSEPKKEIYSCITGKLLTKEEVMDKTYWSKQMLKTVHFYDAISSLPKDKEIIFLELGPGRDLCNIVHRIRSSYVNCIDFISINPGEVSATEIFFNRIAHLWTLGTRIDWEEIYSTSLELRKIHIPTYPFERNVFPYRKSIADIKKISTCEKVVKLKNRDEWFYEPYWEQKRLLRECNLDSQKKAVWLVLGNYTELFSIIVNTLKATNGQVIWVEPGETYQYFDDMHYVIDLGNMKDYEVFVEDVSSKELKINNVIDLLPLEKLKPLHYNNLQALKQAQQNGIYSFLMLIRAFVKYKIMNDMKCMVVTEDVTSITGMEQVNPNYSTLIGLTKVINQEFMNVQCASVDIEWSHLTEFEKKKMADAVINEFNTKLGLFEVGFRKQYRWVKRYRKYPISQEIRKGQSGFRENGVYAIIGGLGRIGYETAKYIMQNYHGTIAVLIRKAIISPEEMDTNPNINPKEILKFQRLEELRQMGNISVYIADLSDCKQVKQSFDEIEAQYGMINGVIHAAGVTGKETSKAVAEISLQDCIVQFKAKVYGLQVLEQALEGKNIEFCLLCSSLSPILGGLGYGAYAGASSFMDSFIYYHNQTSEQKWIDVNWETWLSEIDISGSTHALGSYNAQLTLAVEEAMDIMERILCLHDFNQIVISTCNLESRLKRWLQLEDDTKENLNENQSKERFQSRPQLLNKYIAPETEIEKKLCEIWNNVLGIKGIGVEDNFLELGGDSLKLINSIGVIYKEFNVDIPISDFFKHATISYVAERIESSRSKRMNEITPAEKKDYYAVSSAQKRIFYIETFNRESTMYNEIKIFTLEGKIDVKKIEVAFQQLIKRHEILRTAFVMREDSPVQIIKEHVEFYVTYLEESENVNEIIQSQIHSFDLSNPPLFKVTIIKVGMEKYRLILDMNHIISDGVSEDVLIMEFLALYQGKMLEPLKLQYKDYAEWQLQRKNQGEFASQEEYWIKKYSKEIPKLELPYDHNRPKYKEYEGNSIDFILDEEITGKLKEIAKEQSITLYVLLLSAYSVFLNKLSDTDDIIIGTNTAGRLRAEIQNMLGMFVNTLALRLNPEGNKKFEDFLQEVREEVLDAFQNQDYQFDDLVERVVKERDFSRNPIFDVSFVWENMERIDIVVDGVRFIPYKFANNTSRFDLILFGYEFNDELVFRFEYDTKLFEKETIERFIHYFQYLLENLAHFIDMKIKTISIIPQQELNAFISNNRIGTNLYKDESIISLFESIVEKQSNEIALTDGINNLTYHQLNNQANQLANTLLQQKTGQNSLTVMLLDRKLDMVVAILGILKAGYGYLPLNPEYPQLRIDYTIKDSKAKLVVTNEKYHKLIQDDSMTIVTMESIASDQDNRNPDIKIQPSDLAYVIYTSGTTGNPKGVMIEHRNVVNLVKNHSPLLEFNEHDVWTLFHSYCFDFSVWEIFGSLLTGAKLVVVSKETAQSPKEFLRVLEEQEVTILNQTPTAFENLVKMEEFLNSIKLKLRYVIFGGEKLKALTFRTFKQLHNEVRLINMYGITETCVHVTIKEYNLEDIEKDISDIGEAIPGYQVYIMDSYGQIVPYGVKGEICVSGCGLSRGYLNHEELTLERFVPNPYDKTQRLYKSGDLARQLSTGKIEYCGRKDHQVKIRGHRIELGEIETRLLKCKNINSARAIVRNDIIQMDTICAYVVSKDKLDFSCLYQELSEFLPAYMIPSYFVQLEELPYTSNGKIDVNALPKPQFDIHADVVSPENEIENELLGIWSQILNVDKASVSVEKRLFEIGGNSIVIVQMQRKMEQKFHKSIPITAFFQYVTIRAMARYIQSLMCEENENQKTVETGSDIGNVDNQETLQRTNRLRNRNHLTRED